VSLFETAMKGVEAAPKWETACAGVSNHAKVVEAFGADPMNQTSVYPWKHQCADLYEY